MPVRKLVTIRKVLDLIPIIGADLIELAQVDGWNTVVKKGIFKIGDYGVYHEVDSFLPTIPKYEFLRKGYSKKMLIEGKGMVEGIRVRTIKLKGIESHGLLLPMTEFPELDIHEDINIDLSERLGVIKYEEPIPAEINGDVRGGIPSIIKRTDQERIQNLLYYFDKYKGVEFEETEKEDGTSSTMYLYENHFGVCGHNWEFKENPNQTMWKLAYKHDVAHVMSMIGKEVAIQAETAGEAIQKNKMSLKGHHFHVFDIYDIEKGRYMTPDERYCYIDTFNALTTKEPLVHVPIIKTNVKIFDICHTVKEILTYAEGDTFYCKGNRREGLVYKSVELINGKVVTFKVRIRED
jgi:RNA ligase (TIGR02306 family)